MISELFKNLRGRLFPEFPPNVYDLQLEFIQIFKHVNITGEIDLHNLFDASIRPFLCLSGAEWVVGSSPSWFLVIKQNKDQKVKTFHLFSKIISRNLREMYFHKTKKNVLRIHEFLVLKMTDEEIQNFLEFTKKNFFSDVPEA